MSVAKNNTLTASRMGCVQTCLRKHYWRYEVGLRKDETGLALRFGSAWHRAMEGRWQKCDYETALAMALPAGIDLDAYTCVKLAALLLGYYQHYLNEQIIEMQPEIRFALPLVGSRTFTVEGIIDGLGSASDGCSVLVESKTTGGSLAPESPYWMRLRFNTQVFQYVLAAKASGWQLRDVIYDVTRKPSIRPKTVPTLDEEGLKIVLDQRGLRVYTKSANAGASPRQTGSTEKGYTLQEHLETPDEYSTRLSADIKRRPDFYFARREVAILQEDLEEFAAHRLTVSRIITHCRDEEPRMRRPEQAWPRSVSEPTCKFCEYQSFCLNNISVDLANPPEGFSASAFNPELERIDAEPEEADQPQE